MVRSSSFAPRDNGFPKATPSTNVNFQFLATLSDDNTKESDLWHLGSILFDPLATLGLPHIPDEYPDSSKEKLKMQHRAKLLSAWLKNVSTNDVSRLIQAATSPLEVAFAQLSGGQIPRAAIAASDGKNMHLAVLISLLGTDDLSIRRAAHAQLNDWTNSGSIEAIPEAIRKIYELLNGNTAVSQGPSPVYLCENLSWQQSFGLQLWYETTINGDISVAVKKYEEAFKNPKACVPSPFADPEAFELLRLFESINPQPERALCNTTASSWIPWALYHILYRSLNLYKDTSFIGEQLTLSFALQLESHGKVTEAAFVLTHLENDDLAKRYLQDLVGRQVNKITPEVTSRLKRMGINSHVISEALALQYRYDGEHTLECSALIDATQWNEAHTVLIKHVAPFAVVSNSIGELFNILMRFENPTANIQGWREGGQVYLDYARLVERMSPAEAALDDSALPAATAQGLAISLIKGLAQINTWDGRNFMVQVATTLMSSYVAKKARSLGLGSQVGSTMLDMKMDNNERLAEVREIAVRYFEGQVAA